MDSKVLENAKVILAGSCRAQPGETVLLIIGNDALMLHAPAFAKAASELGLVLATMDIRPFLSSPAYLEGRILGSLVAAMEASDIVVKGSGRVPPGAARADYSTFTGDPDRHDQMLTAERRWVNLQTNGIEEWNISTQEVVDMRKRTLWLLELLRSAKTGHVRTELGTDLTFGLGPEASCNPILGIVPLYAEVAVVPSLQPTHGVFVADGPSQMGVRLRSELDREPLRITVEAGRMVDVKGDPEQVQRLKEFVASGDPAADLIDEVGVLTTKFVDNDIFYWSDGTHHHDRVHIALGNNVRRDKVVHGPRHMDLEVSKPTISIDGLVVVKEGVFQDSVMESTLQS